MFLWTLLSSAASNTMEMLLSPQRLQDLYHIAVRMAKVDSQWTFKFRIEWCADTEIERMEGLQFIPYSKWSQSKYEDLPNAFYTHHHWTIHQKCLQDIDDVRRTRNLQDTVENRKAIAR
eukprot:95534_1